MKQNSISRHEAVLQAAVAIAQARQKAARVYERLIAGGDLYAARWEAHDLADGITRALAFAWAFSGSQQEAAAFMQEAHVKASQILARWEAEEAARESAAQAVQEDGEVPF